MRSPDAEFHRSRRITLIAATGAMLYTLLPIMLNINEVIDTWITLPIPLTFSVYALSGLLSAILVDRSVRAARFLWAGARIVGILFWMSAIYFLLSYCPQ